MNRRIAIAVVALVAVATLFFVLRPDDGEETPATTQTQTELPQLEPLPTVATPEETWRIDVDDDALDRKRVAKDTRLTIVVVAGATDEVHVHGYDLKAPIASGKPTAIFLRASVTGRFEIELEDAQRQIAQLRVTP